MVSFQHVSNPVIFDEKIISSLPNPMNLSKLEEIPTNENKLASFITVVPSYTNLKALRLIQ